MDQNKPPPLDADKIKLLQQAEKIMELAQSVYQTDKTQPEGWKIVAESASDEKDTSGFFARVYEKTGPLQPGESKYVVAFRGTYKPLADPADMGADMQITLGMLPEQYFQARDFVERVCKDKGLNPQEMEFTGHSLGGYLARTVGSTLDAKKIWTFNSPGPTEKIKEAVEHAIPGVSAAPGDKLVQVRSVYDLISHWGYDEGTVFEVKTAGDAHSSANLKEGINAALEGRPPVAIEAPKHRLSLTGLYNAVSKRLSLSRIMNKVVGCLMGRSATPVLQASKVAVPRYKKPRHAFCPA